MKKKRTLIVVILLLLLLLLSGGALLLRNQPKSPPLAELEEEVAKVVASAAAGGQEENSAPPEEPKEPGPYVSPVDFASLQAENPDIYAWLYIPGTVVNYPLLQKDGSDEFYLNHDSNGDYDPKGALFTQAGYNGRDLTDPATVIYGHHLGSGGMFGSLQPLYSGEGGLEQYKNICVYLPDSEQHYEVFAAVPFDDNHILYYNDFSDAAAYQSFLDRVYAVRAIGANVDEENRADTEDQILILSTCLTGNDSKRYLVLSKRIDDRPTTHEVLNGGG